MTFTAAQKASENADQIEAEAVRNGSAPIGAGLADERIAGVDLAEEFTAASNPDGNADWASQDAAQESAEGQAVGEIERRVSLLGGCYPFQLAPDTAQLIYVPERSRSGVYELCLAFATTRQEIKAIPCCFAVREFERLVGRLLARHLGAGTEWFRFGVPPEANKGDQRPTTMSEALADMRRRTHGEWEFHPPVGSDAQAEPGDGQIDVVVWKPFGTNDKRIGKPFLLAQCACGEDSLREDKWKSLDPEQFETTHAGVISFAGVLRCFATPYHIPHDSRWRKAVSAAKIVLDRVRLTWLAESYFGAPEVEAVRTGLATHTSALNQPAVRQLTLTKKKRPKKPTRK